MKKYAGLVPYVPDVRNLRVSALRQLREPVLAAPLLSYPAYRVPLAGYILCLCAAAFWFG